MRSLKKLYYDTDLQQKVGRARKRVSSTARSVRFKVLGRSNIGSGAIDPEKVVWMFGSGRTGSTWLSSMMDEMSDQTVWREPRVGAFFDPTSFERYKGKDFILSPHYKDVWLSSIRSFVLDGAYVRFPEATKKGYLVIKEPGGSMGAPLLMEALPESRMILLVRDPRDVVASWTDAAKKGGWQNQLRRKERSQEETLADTNPAAFARHHARAYVQNVGNAKRAYEDHEGYKMLIRYEDLKTDTLGTMKHLYAKLGMPVGNKELVQIVEKHSWENIPEEKKGEGKFYRKAKPGGWREDLSAQQIKIVEKITAPLLEEFYS